ncbi:MAG TPA: choice-of-anchor tandem repeat GloVer-containing protein [Terriglobales bacterium]
MSGSHFVWRCRRAQVVLLTFALGLIVGATESARAQTETVLHSFQGSPRDGYHPEAGLVRDSHGNLYGTTSGGGNHGSCSHGCGTVFEITKTGNKGNTLYNFTGTPDGSFPLSVLVLDEAGNLYGTTGSGGAFGVGTVFEVTPAGVETVLHSFTGAPDGATPNAGLVRDGAGNLYGTTERGGTFNIGTVFELSSTGIETILYNFTGGTDGGWPAAGLVRDAAGNLFGTTFLGGTQNLNAGVVFKVTPSGTESVLYSFTYGTLDGGSPVGRLVMDPEGNLYGTNLASGYNGEGTVFEVTQAGQHRELHRFSGGLDGGTPMAGLVRDADGNLYGTTARGGAYDEGTVFEVTRQPRSYTVLYNFTGGTDGGIPFGDLLRDANGNLFSTTVYGGTYGLGTVFELSP